MNSSQVIWEEIPDHVRTELAVAAIDLVRELLRDPEQKEKLEAQKARLQGK